MIRSIPRESSYRFRATFRQRWTGYLTLVVLIGLVGGVAMAAVAGARRTQSSFPAYLASTNPSDVGMFTEFDPISNTGYSAQVNGRSPAVPGSQPRDDRHGFDGTLQVLGQNRGTRRPRAGAAGLRGQPERRVLHHGQGDRRPGPDGPTGPNGRDRHVLRRRRSVRAAFGSTLPVAFFTTAQVNAPNFAAIPRTSPTSSSPSSWSASSRRDADRQDDDAALGNQLAVVTPALTRRLEACCAYYSYVSLHLEAGRRHEAAVVSAVNKIIANLGPAGGAHHEGAVGGEGRAHHPAGGHRASALFGLIAALAALVISGQVISRLVRARTPRTAPIVRSAGGRARHDRRPTGSSVSSARW